MLSGRNSSKRAPAVSMDSNASGSEESEQGDRRSVVRTTPASDADAAAPRDFGFSKLKKKDARAYLERKKASGVVNLAYEKRKKSAAALAELAARRKRAAEAQAHSQAQALQQAVAEVATPEHALWVLMGVPLFMLAAAELVSLSAADPDAGKPGLSGAVLFGVGLSVTASCLNALGLNFQRLGQQRDKELAAARAARRGGGDDAGADADDESAARSRSSSKRRPRAASLDALADAPNLNTIGIALAASSGILDLVSFGFAPQSLLAPFGAVTLVVNLVLAPLLHGEHLSRTDVSATALVCTGIALALMSNPGAAPVFSLRELQALLEPQQVRAYLAAYALGIAALANHIYTGEAEGRGGTKAVGVAYPVLSGMLGGLTTLNAKVMTELFKVTSLGAAPQLLLPVIAMVAGFAVAQTAVLNRGLGKHSSLFVVPLFSASFLLANLMGGGVVFNEFAAFEQQQLVGFLLGVALVVAGVSTLATKDEAGGEDGAGDGSKHRSGKRSSKRASKRD